MLERTAGGCLETGGLRRILPGSKNSLKSRRLLHSSFWIHGAGELKLSPLWASLMRGAAHEDEPADKNLSNGNSHTPGTQLLDFLYPPNTVALVRKWSSVWTFYRQESQRSRLSLARSGARLYNSRAADIREYADILETPTPPGEQTEAEDIFQTSSPLEEWAKAESQAEDLTDVAEAPASILSLRDLIGPARDAYEKAWLVYRTKDPVEQAFLRSQLIEYLSTSPRTADATRIVVLFEEMSPTAIWPKAYGIAIQAYLHLGNLRKALALQNFVLEHTKYPVGFGATLSYMVQNSMWQDSMDFCSRLEKWGWDRAEIHHSMRAEIKAGPNFLDSLLGFTRFLAATAEPTTPDDTKVDDTKTEETKKSPLPFHAVGFIKTALTFVPERFDQSDYVTILKYLREWDAITTKDYVSFITFLLEDRGETKIAARLYRWARHNRKEPLSLSVLQKIQYVFYQHDSVMGMNQVFEDWREWWGIPSPRMYRLFLAILARRGELEPVKTLFDRYVEDHWQDKSFETADDLHPLMHVHARRGEVKEVIDIFEHMEERYGVKPNTKSWNILLNAFGRTHDLDEAFSRFEQLLQSGMKPDSITFSTLMGMCVLRGDTDRVVDLFEEARSMGMPITISMIDCLVQAASQDDQLRRAEELCEDAVTMKLDGPLTRMWNYLLSAHAIRRDLENTHRILNRMHDLDIPYDASTYGALIQVLALVGQPDAGWKMITEVMPQAGIKVSSYHYALVMGGLIHNRQTQKLEKLLQLMNHRQTRKMAATKAKILKVLAVRDQENLEDAPPENPIVLAEAEKYFKEAISQVDPKDAVQNSRHGPYGSRPSTDTLWFSLYFEYLTFVYAKLGSYKRVDELYNHFLTFLPEEKRSSLTLEMSSALMAAKFRQRDYAAVDECWKIGLEQAIREGQPVGSDPSKPSKVIFSKRFLLSKHLTQYMIALAQQWRTAEMTTTLEQLFELGFDLDQRNWNLYVQLLVRTYNYRLAFETCESKLIAGWSGWKTLRWELPGRDRLPFAFRQARKWPTVMRPHTRTLLLLTRAYLDLERAAPDSSQAKHVLMDVKGECPLTMRAVMNMPSGSTSDDLEGRLLGGDIGPEGVGRGW